MQTKRPRARPAPVGDVLGNILRRVDPDHQLKAYSVWTFWDHEVGKTIAAHAQPIRFRDGVLFVAVATHTWMQELRFFKDDIRERLNARLGATLVQDIFFVSGQVETPAPTETDVPEESPVGPNLIALPPIPHPELANAFNRVVQARARRLAKVRSATAPGAKTTR
jgi:hypothetical protein